MMAARGRGCWPVGQSWGCPERRGETQQERRVAIAPATRERVFFLIYDGALCRKTFQIRRWSFSPTSSGFNNKVKYLQKTLAMCPFRAKAMTDLNSEVTKYIVVNEERDEEPIGGRGVSLFGLVEKNKQLCFNSYTETHVPL